jgi:hypothetical protein
VTQILSCLRRSSLERPGPEPGESSEPIHKLTQHEIIFGADYRMERIKLDDVDQPR